MDQNPRPLPSLTASQQYLWHELMKSSTYAVSLYRRLSLAEYILQSLVAAHPELAVERDKILADVNELDKWNEEQGQAVKTNT